MTHAILENLNVAAFDDMPSPAEIHKRIRLTLARSIFDIVFQTPIIASTVWRSVS